MCMYVSEDSKSQWQEQIGPGKTSLNAGRQVSGLVVPISQRGQLRLGKVEPPLDSGRSGAPVRACLRSLSPLWGESGWAPGVGTGRQARGWGVERERDLLKNGWLAEAGGGEWAGSDRPSGRGGAQPLASKDHSLPGPLWWWWGGAAWFPCPAQRPGLWDSGGWSPPSLPEVS